MKMLVQFVMSIALLSLASAKADVVALYLDDATPFKQRTRLLADFSAPLSEEKEQDCLDFLKESFPADKADYGRTLQNNLADWLLYQPQHVNPCTKIMLAVVADESADIRWREFCLQKLSVAAQHPAILKENANSCLSTLIEKTDDSRISFSGTALLGLYRLSKLPEPLFEPNELVKIAEHVLASPDFPSANKVTALQVAGLSGSESAITMARSYVTDNSTPIQLRASAIALLGQKGNSEDIPVLENYTNSLDLRLRKAAQSALKNLNS